MNRLRKQHSPGGRHAILLWLGTALLLLLPARIGLTDLSGQALIWRNLAATLGLTGLLFASSWLARYVRRTWVVASLLVAAVLFFVRSLFAGVVWFGGRDFDANFFVHLNGESVNVAWQQYTQLFVLFALGLLLLVVGFAWLGSRLKAPSGRSAVSAAVVAVMLLAIGYPSMPGWHLFAATRAWFQPKQIELDNGRLGVWQQSPLINLEVPTKQQLRARPATPPKNLILLYIESGGLAFMESERYPDLMPHMHRLVAEHGFLPYIHASSYVTIEGLANTMCGTLLPFEQGSNTMAGFDQMVDRLPCLGDVLHAAGYQQSFLGGSDKRFAGKGRFLSVHGYDTVMGMEDWRRMGLKPRPGTWGLSDVDLFKQSLHELKRLRASGKPFNLTMLTIGTHVPGFPYKECAPYRDGESRFLNAVHCTDQLIGRWIQELRARGWLGEDTILVITGDHNFFPSPLMEELFGKKALSQSHLPFVVIGEDVPKPVQTRGSGVDIAPTILDLLGIKTNARFAIGRSLLRDNRVIDYFPTRYMDVYNGHRWDFSDPFDCDPANTTRIPGEQPLSRCERHELSVLLRKQAHNYSAPPVEMRCKSALPVDIRVPAAADDPLTFRISGAPQTTRFTASQRHIDPSQPGLYLLAMDNHGILQWRKYASPKYVAKKLASAPEMDEVSVLIVAWRPGEDDDVSLPQWLLRAGAASHRGAWLFSVAPGQQLQLQSSSHAGVLQIGTADCRALIDTPRTSS